MFRNFNWEWHGAVAAILAAGIAATLVLVGTGNANLNADETTLLSTVVGATVGAIATYLGVKSGRNGTGNGTGTSGTHPGT